MQFLYNDQFTNYQEFLDRKVTNSLCKHVCRCDSDKAREVIRLSCQLGYHYAWWGYGEKYHQDPELNRMVQLSRIQRFIYEPVVRPLRLVIDQNGSLWADNLHMVIAQVICHGKGILMREMPVYIMDMRTSVPNIVDGYRLVNLEREKVTGLLAVSWKRCERSSKELAAVNYTIGEFMAENDLDWCYLTLDDRSLCDRFIQHTDRLMHAGFPSVL